MNLFSNIFRGLGLTSVALLLALTLVAAVPSQEPQQDTDKDGLTDNLQEICKTDPTQIDSDGDGLTYGEEETHGTDPSEADSDGDGLTDCLELKLHKTNPLAQDSDGDGLLDSVEINGNRSNPLWTDTDGDGLTDGEEKTLGTEPRKHDTDGDGIHDKEEVEGPTNPLLEDTDNDGLKDGEEVGGPTDPTDRDTDGDGLLDGEEVGGPTDPTNQDTDGDGLLDGDEVNRHKTDPTKEDTDDDDLSDFQEVTCDQSNPNLFDSVFKGKSDSLFVKGTCLNIEPPEGNGQPSIGGTPIPKPTDPTKVVGHISPTSTPDNQEAAGNPKPVSTMRDGTDAGAKDEITAGSVVTPEPEKQDLFGFFSPDGPLDWLLIAVAGVIAFSIVAALVTFFFLRRSKRGGLQEPPAGPAAQRAVQSRKEAKATELRNLSAILSRQAQELRELSFLDAVVSNPPSVNGDMSALLDREQVVLSAVQTLEGLVGPTGERRVAMGQLVESLERDGLKTAALKRAVEGTPATVLHLLLAALQELNEQLGTSLESTPDYVRQVQAARELCNREINDAVARRLPLSLLDVAGEVLQQAQTAPQQRAAQQVTDGILAAVYRQYFPRLPRR